MRTRTLGCYAQVELNQKSQNKLNADVEVSSHTHLHILCAMPRHLSTYFFFLCLNIDLKGSGAVCELRLRCCPDKPCRGSLVPWVPGSLGLWVPGVGACDQPVSQRSHASYRAENQKFNPTASPNTSPFACGVCSVLLSQINHAVIHVVTVWRLEQSFGLASIPLHWEPHHDHRQNTTG